MLFSPVFCIGLVLYRHKLVESAATLASNNQTRESSLYWFISVKETVRIPRRKGSSP